MKNKGTRGAGRPKGSPNKTTASVKEALVKAFDQLGGVDSLVKWARGEGKAEFYKLWAKMLPTEINAKIAGGLALELVEEIVENDQSEDDQADDSASPEAV